MVKNNKTKLPSDRALREAIKAVEEFRLLCKFMLETGYWATVDFPSRHHINTLLQLQYRDVGELKKEYGLGLTRLALEELEKAKLYVEFLRDTHKEEEDGDNRKKSSGRKSVSKNSTRKNKEK